MSFMCSFLIHVRSGCLCFCLLLQISALKGQNVDDLLETVMLVAEVCTIIGFPAS